MGWNKRELVQRITTVHALPTFEGIIAQKFGQETKIHWNQLTDEQLLTLARIEPFDEEEISEDQLPFYYQDGFLVVSSAILHSLKLDPNAYAIQKKPTNIPPEFFQLFRPEGKRQIHPRRKK